MTKEDWEKVKNAWETPFAIKLQVDGFKVDIYMEHYKMKMHRVVYVDGYFKFEWCNKQKDGEYPEEGKRFFPTTKRRLYSTKEVKEYQKIFGKRAAKIYQEKRVEYKKPHWSSFNAFKKHLITNNENIELIEC